jgi:carboxyl-terminal processing protease
LKRWLGLLALVLAAIGGLRAEAEPRVALVIGNAHYSGHYLAELANPINDARLMTETLKQVGFRVIRLEDVDQKQMKRAIADFGDAVAAVGPTATAAFYYAGHGVQIGGMGFLIPIGAEISREADVEIEAISVASLREQLAFAGNKVSILMLDAARNNPLSREFRSAGSGLSEPSILKAGMFVSYATSAGDSAADGSGPNGPYAAAVSKAILTPSLTIDEVFRRVRAEMSATAHGRTTVDSSTLDAAFYFLPKN